MRGTNAIDFWRGVALVMIFVNHMPGNELSYVTLRNFAVIDAAELFVFLAGWSLYHATGGRHRPETWQRVSFRLATRSIELYRAHLVISVLAFALCGALGRWTGNAAYLEWNGAGPMFQDSPAAMLGLVLLTYQLGYFNILPLYVVLLLMAVPLILALQRSLLLGLCGSLAVYGLALVTRASPPAWPSFEQWYFNPLSWQLLIVVGYVSADLASRPFIRRLASDLLPAAVVTLILGLVIARFQLYPDPLAVPEPRMVFLFNKTYLSPFRLISLVALVVAFHRVYAWIEPRVQPVDAYCRALGRNSLAVFSIGSLLSLLGQFIRFQNGDRFVIDLMLVVGGLVVLGFTAWFVEWRERWPQARAVSGSS